MQIDIEIKCERCGRSMEPREEVKGATIRLHVEPCQWCEEAAELKAQEEGEAAGRIDGKAEGRAEAEAEHEAKE